MIRSMAKARSSKKGRSEGLDLFAFAAVKVDAPGVSIPEPTKLVELAAADEPAALACKLLAFVGGLQDGDLLGLLSALDAEAQRRGLAPVRAANEPAPKPGSRLKSPPGVATSSRSTSLPTSKANAIRAALEAGVKPGAVACQFGVSVAQIRKLFDAG